MKFTWRETDESRIEKVKNWHRWFAWYPVRVAEKKVGNKMKSVLFFFCVVERKKTWIDGGICGGHYNVEYREAK